MKGEGNDECGMMNDELPSGIISNGIHHSSFIIHHSRSVLSILLLGDTARTEFDEARSVLDRWGTVQGFDAVDTASASIVAAEVVPDLIVVAQAFPGQFSHQAIDRLRRLAPLARLVGLMGSWCEGELRSGAPWPAVVRCYCHQWTDRCNRQLARLTVGTCCSWALPPTATEEERLLVDSPALSNRKESPPQRGLVLIHAPKREMSEWLSAACRSRGYATVWQRSSAALRAEGATAAIFDGAYVGPEDFDQLQRLATTLHPAPVIALLAFPRVEDKKRALSAGAAAVVSKPVAVDDLFWELERVGSE